MTLRNKSQELISDLKESLEDYEQFERQAHIHWTTKLTEIVKLLPDHKPEEAKSILSNLEKFLQSLNGILPKNLSPNDFMERNQVTTKELEIFGQSQISLKELKTLSSKYKTFDRGLHIELLNLSLSVIARLALENKRFWSETFLEYKNIIDLLNERLPEARKSVSSLKGLFESKFSGNSSKEPMKKNPVKKLTRTWGVKEAETSKTTEVSKKLELPKKTETSTEPTSPRIVNRRAPTNEDLDVEVDEAKKRLKDRIKKYKEKEQKELTKKSDKVQRTFAEERPKSLPLTPQPAPSSLEPKTFESDLTASCTSDISLDDLIELSQEHPDKDVILVELKTPVQEDLTEKDSWVVVEEQFDEIVQENLTSPTSLKAMEEQFDRLVQEQQEPTAIKHNNVRDFLELQEPIPDNTFSKEETVVKKEPEVVVLEEIQESFVDYDLVEDQQLLPEAPVNIEQDKVLSLEEIKDSLLVNFKADTKEEVLVLEELKEETLLEKDSKVKEELLVLEEIKPQKEETLLEQDSKVKEELLVLEELKPQKEETLLEQDSKLIVLEEVKREEKPPQIVPLEEAIPDYTENADILILEEIKDPILLQPEDTSKLLQEAQTKVEENELKELILEELKESSSQPFLVPENEPEFKEEKESIQVLEEIELPVSKKQDFVKVSTEKYEVKADEPNTSSNSRKNSGITKMVAELAKSYPKAKQEPLFDDEDVKFLCIYIGLSISFYIGIISIVYKKFNS